MGTASHPETDALNGSSPVIANDRPVPPSPLSTPASAMEGRVLDLTPSGSVASGASGAVEHRGERTTQTAEFAIGEFRLALAAEPGSATLTIAMGAGRDAYALEPDALSMWADAVTQLLALGPAASATERAEFRTPFLMDVEGRSAIAFECSVEEQGVTFDLVVTGAADRIGVARADVETVRIMVEAARGAVALAHLAPVSDSPGA